MTTLNYILKKFNIAYNDKTPMPIEIPGVGRDELARILSESNFKSGVEIGIAAGEYSEILSKGNPQMKLFGVDPYIPHRGYHDITRTSTFEKNEKEAHEKLDKFPNYEFIKKFSMDAVKDFKDNSLDFVYIDANHDFQSVTNDIVEWSKKIKAGGIISGHDYYRHRNHENIHVYQVVNAITDAYHIRPWFALGADHPRSWMWIL